MENKAHALAAGTFVLMVAAMLVALAWWLTRDAGIHRIYELSTRDAVSGLQSQAAVRFRGVNVGKVTSIGFDPQVSGNVLVRIAVDSQAPITKSTWASLGFQGVTGLSFVQLDDGGESKEPLATDDAAPARIPLRPGLMATLSERGTTILTQLEESSRRVNQLLHPDNQKALIGAITQMGQAAGQVVLLSGQAQKMMEGPVPVKLPELVQGASETLRSIQDTSQRLGSSADTVRESAAEFRRMSERMNQVGGTLEKIAEGADTLVSTGRSLNAATLPRLNRTVSDAGQAVKQAGRAFATVGDNPQALIFGASPATPGPGEPGFAARGATP